MNASSTRYFDQSHKLIKQDHFINIYLKQLQNLATDSNKHSFFSKAPGCFSVGGKAAWAWSSLMSSAKDKVQSSYRSFHDVRKEKIAFASSHGSTQV